MTVRTERISSGKSHEVCLCWICDDSRLCFLPRYHTGSHLASPLPWPRQDVSAANPVSPKGHVA